MLIHSRKQGIKQRLQGFALAKCLYEGRRIWIYAGSVQTLEYVTYQELQQCQTPDAPLLSAKQLAS